MQDPNHCWARLEAHTHAILHRMIWPNCSHTIIEPKANILSHLILWYLQSQDMPHGKVLTTHHLQTQTTFFGSRIRKKWSKIFIRAYGSASITNKYRKWARPVIHRKNQRQSWWWQRLIKQDKWFCHWKNMKISSIGILTNQFSMSPKLRWWEYWISKIRPKSCWTHYLLAIRQQVCWEASLWCASYRGCKTSWYTLEFNYQWDDHSLLNHTNAV